MRAHGTVRARCALAIVALLAACGSDGGRPTPDRSPGDGVTADARRPELVADAGTEDTAEVTVVDAQDEDVATDAVAEAADEATDEAWRPDADGFDVGGGERGPAHPCEGLADLAGTEHDASLAIQDCIDRTASGGILALPPGRFLIARQIVLARPMTISTWGKSEADPPCAVDDVAGTCFTLVASADFLIMDPAQPGLLWVPPSAAGATLDHLIVDGNNLARLGSAAANRCTGAGLTEPPQITYGYNVTVAADGVRLLNSVSRNALCGTGMEVDGKQSLTIVNNHFASNGLHDRFLLWADGLTVTDAVDSVITDNHASDNSDIDIILGGCRGCIVRRNLVTHGDSQTGSSFAAFMLTVWPPPSVPSSTGDFTGADIADNRIDCGPGKRCGFGLDIGTDAWVPDGPLAGGAVHDNVIRNAQQGLNVAHTTGVVRLYDNVVEACGGVFVTACGPRTLGAYNISPTSVVDRSGDDVPDVAYTHEDWTGCLPNP